MRILLATIVVLGLVLALVVGAVMAQGGGDPADMTPAQINQMSDEWRIENADVVLEVAQKHGRLIFEDLSIATEAESACPVPATGPYTRCD